MKSDKETQERKIFSGGMQSFITHARVYEALGASYKVSTFGSVKELIYGDKVLRFVTSSDKQDKRLGYSCLSVIRDVKKYEETKGVLSSEPRTTFYRNNGLFTDYVMKGGRELYLVDIKACYWNIVHKAGIISDKTYDTYKNDKLLRLMTVGNLNKRRIVSTYQNGKRVGEPEVIDSPHSWVWSYVLYKAYEVFETVNQYIGMNVMMFKTDCFFISPEHLSKVERILHALGFDYTVERRVIEGYCGSRVVTVSSDGELKLSSFGSTIAFRKFLPPIEVDNQIINDAAKLEKEDDKLGSV